MSGSIAAVSLFSGAGGLDIASFMAGVPVIASTDFDKDCIATLKANGQFFGDTQIIEGDISSMDSRIFADIVKDRSPGKFIVIGGAPCQPFSKAGYWVGNRRKGINDPRAFLVNEYLRIVTDISPDGFVFENVESLLHPSNRTIIDRFTAIVSEAGYDFRIIRANALDYGVPQKRKRLFIVGTKGRFKHDAPAKTHCPPDKCGETGLKPYVTAGNAIAGYSGGEFYEEGEDPKGGKYYGDLCRIPPGQNYKALTAWAGCPEPRFTADKRFWNFLLKLSPDMPSWTVCAQPGPWTGPFHWDNRRLRMPELAAIQTFPEGYRFCGSRRSVQKQIGNAVPCLMGKAVVEFLKESLE